MSYTVLTGVMASLASQSVPRVLAHVKVLRALPMLERAKERGGDALEKTCWTVACMAHASKGAVALDAPAEVSQVLTTMKGQDLTVNSLRQALLEQQSMDVQANELQSVLRRLAQEEGTTFQYNERNGQIKVF